MAAEAEEEGALLAVSQARLNTCSPRHEGNAHTVCCHSGCPRDAAKLVSCVLRPGLMCGGILRAASALTRLKSAL